VLLRGVIKLSQVSHIQKSGILRPWVP
jgi:hypothetical protein